jgi:hypothetical protein
LRCSRQNIMIECVVSSDVVRGGLVGYALPWTAEPTRSPCTTTLDTTHPSIIFY